MLGPEEVEQRFERMGPVDGVTRTAILPIRRGSPGSKNALSRNFAPGRTLRTEQRVKEPMLAIVHIGTVRRASGRMARFIRPDGDVWRGMALRASASLGGPNLHQVERARLVGTDRSLRRV